MRDKKLKSLSIRPKFYMQGQSTTIGSHGTLQPGYGIFICNKHREKNSSFCSHFALIILSKRNLVNSFFDV